MLNTDDEVRAALRTALDEPPPPSMTKAGLSDALRTGRRKRMQRRVVAAAGAFAVIATASVTAIALHGGGTHNGTSLQTASGAPSITWSTVPATTVHTSAKPLWAKQSHTCQAGQFFSPAKRRSPMPSESTVKSTMADAVQRAVPNMPISDLSSTYEAYNGNTAKGPMVYAFAHMKSPAGTDSVDLTIVNFDGTPTQAADANAFDSCGSAPQRATLPDGTVLQLYATDDWGTDSAGKNMQRTLHVYTPGGHLYLFTEYNAPINEEFRPDAIPPRPSTLPLDANQLGQIGKRFDSLH